MEAYSMVNRKKKTLKIPKVNRFKEQDLTQQQKAADWERKLFRNLKIGMIVAVIVGIIFCTLLYLDKC